MKYKTMEERYGDEVLSDNSHHYLQCKDCFFRDERNYKRGNCRMFALKPISIQENREDCEYYVKDADIR